MNEPTEIVTLTDEEGQETDFAVLEMIPLNGTRYAVLSPCDEEEDDGVLIFEVALEAGEEAYLPVEDDAVVQRVFDAFVSGDEDYAFCDAE